ncbi:MAG: hypothetical protein GC180_03720 [Bacteroidetes bacterium]|nr:hypothetical protein [Bacteroidota bacterium]
MMKKIIALLLLSLPFLASGQNECANSLDQAGKLYHSGKLNDAIRVLEPCYEKIDGKREKFEALRLLSLMNYELDNRQDAEKYAILMFRIRPYYFNYPNNDPAAFHKFISEFKIRPRIQVGLTTGVLLNQPILLQNYMATKGTNTYKSSAGILLAGNFIYSMDKLSFSGNVGILGTSLAQIIKEESGTRKNYKESLRMLQFSVGAKWKLPSFLGQDFHIGTQAGISQIISAQATLETRNSNLTTVVQDSKNALNEKNKTQFFLEPNFYWNHMLKNRHIMRVGVSYQYYFQNLVNPASRLINQQFVFANEYMNDDVRLGIWKLSFSYIVPLDYHISH